MGETGAEKLRYIYGKIVIHSQYKGGIMSDTGMLNLRMYSACFLNNNGRLAPKYNRAASDENFEKFAVLTGQETAIDTALEIALLSYSAGVVDIRPSEAAAMLPADNPKLAGQKLGAALYQEIQVLRFLGGSSDLTAQIGRYEGMLKFVCDRNGVSRAEVESFYCANLRAHIAEIVSEEFNKISFRLYNYNAVLTRNPQNGQYVLSYERPSIGNDDETLPPQTLDALLTEMRRNTVNFTKDDIDTVSEKANLIPAIALNQQALSDITDIIYSFYISTDQNQNYGYLRDVHALYRNLADNTGKLIFQEIARAYARTLYELNPALESKVSKDGWNNRNYVIITAEQRQRLAAFR
jgi:hypothetical protein